MELGAWVSFSILAKSSQWNFHKVDQFGVMFDKVS